jgi:hypothetical protein
MPWINGGQERPLSLSLSPLARGEGIENHSCTQTLPKNEMRTLCAWDRNPAGVACNNILK